MRITGRVGNISGADLIKDELWKMVVQVSSSRGGKGREREREVIGGESSLKVRRNPDEKNITDCNPFIFNHQIFILSTLLSKYFNGAKLVL